MFIKLLNLYYSFIYPNLAYCVEANWSNTPDTYLDPLIKFKKKTTFV